MPIDYSGGTLKEFGPKVGESKVIHIRESVKVEDATGNSEENFRSQTKNWGYRFEITLTNGRIFTLNTWRLFFAFKKPVNAELDEKNEKIPVQDGDKIQIDHPANSEYSVTILEKGTGIGVIVEDTEKIAYDETKKTNSGQETAVPASSAAPASTTPGVTATPAPAPAPAPEVKKPAEVTPKPADDNLDLPF